MGYLEYCSDCGARNDLREVAGRRRQVCTRCGTIHYENPRPAVTVVVARRDSIPLIKRAVPPAVGQWCLPGGFMELGESAAQAARRELVEETNLTALGITSLGICSRAGGGRGDLLIAGFAATKVSGRLKAGDDALEAQYFPLDSMPPLPFYCHREMIERFTLQRSGAESAKGIVDWSPVTGPEITVITEQHSTMEAGKEGAA